MAKANRKGPLSEYFTGEFGYSESRDEAKLRKMLGIDDDDAPSVVSTKLARTFDPSVSGTLRTAADAWKRFGLPEYDPSKDISEYMSVDVPLGRDWLIRMIHIKHCLLRRMINSFGQTIGGSEVTIDKIVDAAMSLGAACQIYAYGRHRKATVTGIKTLKDNRQNAVKGGRAKKALAEYMRKLWFQHLDECTKATRWMKWDDPQRLRHAKSTFKKGPADDEERRRLFQNTSDDWFKTNYEEWQTKL